MQVELEQFQEKCTDINERAEIFRLEYEKRMDKLKSVKLASVIMIVIGVPLILFMGLGILLIWIFRFVYKKNKEKMEDLERQYYFNQSQLGQEYEEEIYLPIAEQGFLYGNYSKKNLEEQFKQSGLCQPENIEFYGGMSGAHKGITFKETLVQLYKYKRNGARIDCFEGTIIQFDNPKPCATPVFVQSKMGAFMSEGGVREIKNIDHPQFKSNTTIYGDDALSAFRILTPAYMEKLLPHIENREIDMIVYGQENIMIISKNKGVHYRFYGHPPFTVEQCLEEIEQKNEQLKQIIEGLYNAVVESMR